MSAIACSVSGGDGSTLGAGDGQTSNASSSGQGGAGDTTWGDGASSDAGGGDVCAISTETARQTEVNMFISFDKSGSMDGDDKWPDATAALKSFFQDPGTDGLRVAMRFFGDDLPGGAGCSQYICNAAACAVPNVDVDYLDAAANDPHEQALTSAIDARKPGGGGGTPIHPALDGATSWAKGYKDAHPGDEVVVVLVTDGAPQGCIEAVPAISALAAGAQASHGIATYAIGLAGSSDNTMNQIAAAGGTGQAIFINNGNVTSELLAALQQIQTEATLPCQFAMPTGEDVDPTKVNLELTPGGGPSQQVGQVASAADCVSVADGWYYDDPANPTTIILCPQTCDAAQGDPDATVDIVVGCQTVAAVPK